jgi:hypothetical protein
MCGRARASEIDPAVDDHPAADPLGQHHVEQVPLATPGAERRLSKRAEVGVVTDVDRNVQTAPEELGHVDLGPAREDHPGREPRGVRADGRRHRNPGAEHPVG